MIDLRRGKYTNAHESAYEPTPQRKTGHAPDVRFPATEPPCNGRRPGCAQSEGVAGRVVCAVAICSSAAVATGAGGQACCAAPRVRISGARTASWMAFSPLRAEQRGRAHRRPQLHGLGRARVVQPEGPAQASTLRVPSECPQSTLRVLRVPSEYPRAARAKRTAVRCGCGTGLHVKNRRRWRCADAAGSPVPAD